MTPLVAAAGIWLLVGALCITFRARRVPDHLEYGHQLPQPPKGIAGLGVGIARSFEVMTWGSSYAMWRARCDASLRASRRRRGVDEPPREWNGFPVRTDVTIPRGEVRIEP